MSSEYLQSTIQVVLGLALLGIVICRVDKMRSDTKEAVRFAYFGLGIAGIFAAIEPWLYGQAAPWPALAGLAGFIVLTWIRQSEWARGVPESMRKEKS